MNNKFSIILYLVFFSTRIVAQSNDFYSLKNVDKYRFDRLELTTEKDVTVFIKNTSDYNFITALKINNTVNLNAVLNKLNNCYALNELNLKNYEGNFTKNSFDSCQQIEWLQVSLTENKLSQLPNITKLKNLSSLYLFIKGKPEKIDELKALPNIKELHIIADLLPADIAKITDYITGKMNMQTFGISLDRITDLPKSITKLYYLSTLVLYDNLSLSIAENLEDLTEYATAISFNIADDLPSMIQVKYYASSALGNYENEYLEKLYKGEIISDNTALETASIDNKSISFRKEFSPDFKSSPEFNYPYSSVKPKEEIFMIDGTTNASILSESGLKLIIPQNSFISTMEENIKDPIYIKIVQIPRAIDALFCGFNLKIGNSNLANQFLFNIQASTAKNEVVLKPNMQIKALLPVSKDSASYEYYFDYESNSWQDLALYNSVFSNDFTPIDFYKIETNLGTKNAYIFDSSTFENRLFYGTNYFLNDKNINTQLLFKKHKFYTDLDRTWTKTYNNSGKKDGARIKRGRGLVKIQKVTPKKRNKERQYFKILDKTDKALFAELKHLKALNLNLKINLENKKELADNYIKNKKYNDVRIYYSQGKETCKILLKTEEGLQEIEALITDSEDAEIIKKQISKFYKAYRKYEKTMNNRKESFNSLNNLRYKDYETFLNAKSEELIKNKQTAELKIHQLGTFGLVKMQEHNFNTNLVVHYADERGLPIDVKEIYMLDDRYATPIKLEKDKIFLTPINCQLIVATDYNGNIYYANKSDIIALNFSNNSLTFIKLNTLRTKLNSIESFLNYSKY